MNTPTHVLVAAAALARRDDVPRNSALLAGALAPDLSIYVLFVWARIINGVSGAELWGKIYWQEPWQTLGAISNSVPLYVAILIAGWALKARLMVVFAIAALLHLALDLPFHNSDAHIHFWPISDWRFHSPISYWDREHHGGIVSLLEFGFGLVLISLLWMRFQSITTRVLLALCAVSYVAVPTYFMWSLGG